MKKDLRKFITENFLFGNDESFLSDDDSFLGKGLIDSTGILELVAFLEEKYAIKIQDDDLVPENLDSINSLIRFLTKKSTPEAIQEAIKIAS